MPFLGPNSSLWRTARDTRGVRNRSLARCAANSNSPPPLFPPIMPVLEARQLPVLFSFSSWVPGHNITRLLGYKFEVCLKVDNVYDPLSGSKVTLSRTLNPPISHFRDGVRDSSYVSKKYVTGTFEEERDDGDQKSRAKPGIQ